MGVGSDWEGYSWEDGIRVGIWRARAGILQASSGIAGGKHSHIPPLVVQIEHHQFEATIFLTCHPSGTIQNGRALKGNV